MDNGSDDNLIDYNDDSDSDEELQLPTTAARNSKESEESRGKIPSVLLKTRPKHSYLLLRGNDLHILRSRKNNTMGFRRPLGFLLQHSYECYNTGKS